MPSDPKNSKQLTTDEARQLVERLAAISDASLPLASGLRAAANEVSSPRVRSTMEQLANRFDGGASWQDVLNDQLQIWPAGLSGTILAALESGHVGDVLGRYVQQRTESRDLVMAIRGALAYPILLLVISFALFMIFSLLVMPDLQDMIQMFYLKTNGGERFMEWWSSSGAWYVLKAIPLVVLGVFVLRVSVGAARWRRMIDSIPLVGPVWHWIGVVEWSRMLSVFLGHGIPLPQAIRWASQGSSDANIRQYGLELSQGTQQGSPLSGLLESRRRMPPTLAPLVRWGEQVHNLSGALDTAAEYFEDRVRLRIALVRTIAPPVLFAFIVTLVFIMIGSLLAVLMPTVNLISKLS